jgi:hypothetical protein
VLLAYIKKIFYNREYYTMAQFVTNPIAFQLFHTDEEGFLQRVRKCVDEASTTVYDNYEPTSLKFMQYCDEDHEDLLSMFNTADESLSDE